ncbi:MAG: cupredoxin domain-containing protein [Candidatus Falkowbacteria bacterium]
MQTNNKKMFILLGVIAVVVIIIIVAATQSKKTQSPIVETNTNNNRPATSATTSAEEIAPSKDVTPSATATPEIIASSVSVAVGTSLITKDNKVVTPEGAPVKLNVMPSSADAPKESAPITAGQVPAGANTVKLSVSAAGFSPNSFTVKEGALVNFVLTSTDSFTHVFLPDDRALTATALGVAGGETRVKSWNAPKKGSYTFRCDIPGHASRGEVGTMIVQ